MKNLEMIKDPVCPECGSDIKSEAREDKHTNGHWREFRTFKCRKRLEFSPNLLRVADDVYHPCTKSDAYKKTQERRANFKRKILDLAKEDLNKKDCKDFNERITMYLWLG